MKRVNMINFVLLLMLITTAVFSKGNDIDSSTDILIHESNIPSGDSAWHPVKGGALYLLRSGTETHRAEFRYAEDCEYVAAALSTLEPNVKWYCSTSTPVIQYKCIINNVKIANTEKQDTTTEKFDFNMSLNRKKARLTLSPAISSFAYNENKNEIALTNDYLYAKGNYYSRAIFKIKIQKQTGATTVYDIQYNVNGTGTCELCK
jgi:hypothetical protein